MDSWRPPSLTSSELEDAMAGYQRALPYLSNAELMSQLATINAALESQARESLTSVLLSDYRRTLDQPVLRSPTEGTPSQPADRATPPSPYRPPSPAELLAAAPRTGPRLAARLLAASAKAYR